MSRESADAVRGLFEAWNERGFDGVAGILDPEIEFEEDPRFPEAGTYSGREDVLAYLREFSSQFEDVRFRVDDVVEVGDDTFLACLRLEGRGKGSDAFFDARPGWLCTMREGRVTRVKAYLERAEALAELGLEE